MKQKIIALIIAVTLVAPQIAAAAEITNCPPGDSFYRCRIAELNQMPIQTYIQPQKPDPAPTPGPAYQIEVVGKRPTKTTAPDPSTVDALPTDSIQKDADAIAAQQAKDTTDKGQTLGCGSAGEFGGSMSASLDKALKGMLSQLVGQGISAINGKVGELLNSIASKAGPLAPLVNIVTSKIQEKITSTLNSLGQEVLSSFGGGAEQAVSAAAQALGISNIGAIAGLGSMFGAAGVGIAVPVDVQGQVRNDTRDIKDLSEKIEKHSEIIQQMQKLSGWVTCVGNPAISKAKNALGAQQTKSTLDQLFTGNNGGPYFSQDPDQDIQDAVDVAVKDLVENRTAGICSTYKPTVQQAIVEQFQYDHSIEAQTSCTMTPEEEAELDKPVPDFNTKFASLFDPSKSQIGTFLMVGSAVNEKVAAIVARSAIDQVANSGWINKVECRDDAEPTQGGYCVNGKIITVPGSLMADEAAFALTVPTQQLIEADEIGELIDSLSQGLMQFAFQNINGLIGLSGDEGGGSYLDQLVTEAFSADPGGRQSVMSGDLVGSLETELMYRDLVTLVINDLNNARATYREVVACYSQYTTTGTGTITPALARESLDLASTTISTALDPQIRDLTLLLNDSNASVNELTSLIEQADNALSNEELVSIANQFNALQASGILHNSTDLQYLQTGITTSIGTIETLLRDSQIKLSVCRAS